ncbi:MAG: protein-L-isoaspartate(D-aspartate) O-methyltransferase [Planctomycetes bacterium]|jgi:protein-L-isoaspartate(D-aspartate) O-methyltransferase|nr:protein-L-isoaspartate(D-aspartate) O-methyltransferase [Planctomycetota bacterium]
MALMVERKDDNGLAEAREHMRRHDLRGRDITDPDVLRVMAQIPREEFVPPEYRPQAYKDGPLPIGGGQTISQPYIVALMTQLLRVRPGDEVLEVGTGSGYQTAILACLAQRVSTIERSPELSVAARAVLAKLGIENVEFRIGDGSRGWPEARAFSRIMITAAVPDVPPPLTAQLAGTGIMIAPVGQGAAQELIVAEKHQGKLIETSICGCRFVKLIGEYGFSE